MSGHEFEKQVRQKLDDLKLVPTSRVWENIEEGLRERKRRPAAIYWLTALLLALSATGYFLITPRHINTVAQVTPQPDKTPAATQKESLKPTLRRPGSHTLSDKLQNDLPDNRIADQENVLRANQNARMLMALPEPATSLQTNVSVSTIAPETPQALKTPYEISLKHAQPTLRTEAQRIQIEIPVQPFASQPTLTHAQPGKKIKAVRWSYGLQSSAGISAVNEGKLLGFNNARVEDVSTVAPFAPQQPYQPSSISPGFTYSIGGFVQRELSTKFSLSVGLNYLQINTHNKVGSEINSRAVVNNGTRGYIFVPSYFTIERDYTTEYRNRYHFIELPVSLHTRLNKSKKLPIHANTGIAVSRLIKSNSLHFDGTTGVYYQNDKLLNRTQLAANAGLSVGILNKTTRPIQIGPSVRYNVSKILEKDVSTRKNFMSFGINARMFIR